MLRPGVKRSQYIFTLRRIDSCPMVGGALEESGILSNSGNV